ncbi:Spo0E like sporulation regulatory protein [compost metagenome]
MDTINEMQLCTEIEQIRSEMVVLGTIHGFLHPEVQACSRQLDVLLLQYYSDNGRID